MGDPNVLTQQGDLLYYDGAAYQRLPRGGDGQLIIQAGNVPTAANYSGGSVMEWQGLIRRDITSPVGIRPGDLVTNSLNYFALTHLYIAEGPATGQPGSSAALGILDAIGTLTATNKAYIEVFSPGTSGSSDRNKWFMGFITAVASGSSGGVNYRDLTYVFNDAQSAFAANDLVVWRIRSFAAA